MNTPIAHDSQGLLCSDLCYTADCGCEFVNWDVLSLITALFMVIRKGMYVNRCVIHPTKLTCLSLLIASYITHYDTLLPSGQNLTDSVGNLRGFWLLVEGIHVEIWVVSETRIRAEIQGKFLNWG